MQSNRNKKTTENWLLYLKINGLWKENVTDLRFFLATSIGKGNERRYGLYICRREVIVQWNGGGGALAYRNL